MLDPTPNRPARGYTIALASAAILSTTAIFIRHLTRSFGMPALVLAFWRDLFACLALVPALALLRPALLRVQRRHLPLLAGSGLVLALFNATWTLSVAWNGAAVATVLVYSSGAFTALLGWRLLGERLGPAKLLAVVLSLGGCMLVSGALAPLKSALTSAGIAAGVLSGLCYAGYSLVGRSAAQRGLSPWTTLLFTFSFATLLLLAVNLLPWPKLPGAALRPAELLWLGRSAEGWAVLVLLAVGPTIAGFGLYNVSLAHLPASVVNLIVTLEPVFTAALAFVLLGERWGFAEVAGSCAILLGVAVLRIFGEKVAGTSRIRVPGQALPGSRAIPTRKRNPWQH